MEAPVTVDVTTTDAQTPAQPAQPPLSQTDAPTLSEPPQPPKPLTAAEKHKVRVKKAHSWARLFWGLLLDALGDVTLSLLTKYTVVLMSFFLVPGDSQAVWGAIGIVLFFLLGVLANLEGELVALSHKIAAPLQRKQSFQDLFQRGLVLMFYRVIFFLTVRATAQKGLYDNSIYGLAVALTPVTWTVVLVLTQVLLGRSGRAARVAQLAILNLDAISELLTILSFYPMVAQADHPSAEMFQVRDSV
jgi:hypothetical protein